MQPLIVNSQKIEKRYLLEGLHNAFVDTKHTSMLYEENNEDIFKIFELHSPDMLVCYLEDINRAMFKNILARKNDLKICIYVDAWHSTAEETKRVLATIINKGIPLKNIFATHDYPEWQENFGINTVTCMSAADVVRYKPGKLVKEFSSDIGFLGCFDKDKEDKINNFLMPLCNNYSMKIFGHGLWPTCFHVGSFKDSDLPDIVASTKININFCRAINDRIFKIAACKGFCLSHSCCDRYITTFKDSVTFFDNDLYQKIAYYLINENERTQEAEKLHQFVLNNHTYHHRIQTLIDNS